MKRTNQMRGLMCALAIAGLAGIATAQQHDPKMPDAAKIQDAAKDAMKQAQPDAPAMDAKQMAEMQKAWEEAMKLGPEHEKMKKSVGMWDCTIKTMMPGMPSEETKGSMKIEPMFGGRYQKGHFKGSVMGQEFEGFMLTGFNTATGEYESTWIDSMSTGMMYSKGKPEGNGCALTGEFVDPMTKQKVKQREVTRWVNDNQFVMEFFHEMGGNENHVMTITYDRAKGGDKPADKSGAGTDAMKKAKEEAERKAKEEAEKLKNKMPGR